MHRQRFTYTLPPLKIHGLHRWKRRNFAAFFCERAVKQAAEVEK
jgi:hypothetical protein